VLPASVTYHLGFARDAETRQTTMYLNKLPKQFMPGRGLHSSTFQLNLWPFLTQNTP